MKIRKWAAITLMGVSLCGCVSAGVQVQPEKLQAMKVGETTYQEVVARLGTPTANVISSNGQRVIVYSFVHSQARPESFIPIVGPLVGGADATANSVTFIFGPDGKLMSYSSSDANVGASTGAAAGYEPPVPDQPRRVE
jgi:outer membrane protein assembly factor BamE (lipoprotein component of BamABCDE complex)